ncbi:hypothetical protein ACH9EU_14115 [Kocuria sp. M1R5S2]|uniref:hypothetical protein n=1 Tax=Kocuria rhizosphaerae TaxID=3376285 RepID=UPI00378F2C19
MHRPSRSVLAALATALALVVTGCAGEPSVPDPAPAGPSATPLTAVDAGEVARRRGLPEHYRQPAVPVEGREKQAPATVTVSAEPTGEDWADGGVGLSFEATDLADGRLSADNEDLVALVRELDRPTLRFGGNSVDRRFFFTDDDEAPPTDWPLPAGDEITTVTPQDLRRVAGFAEATGADVVLGVNLAADDARRAASLTRHAEAAFGDDLTAVMVGNEPNGYRPGEDHRLSVKEEGWGIPAYLEDLREYTRAIRAEAPGLAVTAPGAYAPDWWEAVAGSGLRNMVLAAHQYPLSSCHGARPWQTPTMDNLVGVHTRANVDRFLGIAVDQARRAGMPLWLTESSVSACLGGNDITETLGAAVFSAEYSLRAQSLGVERLVHHSSLDRCAGGPPMSSVCSSGTRGDQGSAFAPRANHLALALVGRIPAGDFLRTDGSGNEDVTAYAIRHPAQDGGRQELTVVLTNFTDPAVAGRAPVTLRLPFDLEGAVMSQMGGPAWDAEFPAASLFDVEPEDGGQPTADRDGRAQTLGNALEPVGDAHVSVDGFGLPLAPVEHRSAVPGAEPGQDALRLSLNPGTVTVLTVTGVAPGAGAEPGPASRSASGPESESDPEPGPARTSGAEHRTPGSSRDGAGRVGTAAGRAAS